MDSAHLPATWMTSRFLMSMTFFMVRFMVLFVMMLMLGCVDWVVMDWDCDNMWFHNNWVSKGSLNTIKSCTASKSVDNLRDFHGNMDWIRHFHFLDDRDLDFLVHWELLRVMVMNRMNFVRDFDLDGFAVKATKLTNLQIGRFTNLLSTSAAAAKRRPCWQCYQYHDSNWCKLKSSKFILILEHLRDDHCLTSNFNAILLIFLVWTLYWTVLSTGKSIEMWLNRWQTSWLL